ncbi:Protein-glutamine gamma-glutamyltransferase [Rubripirellula obstinata]|uniref:Protein-glutamine gamma-glutamyltransferase n=1 Tax=Rubripirellula obstinata TaxID=406547 RepID=A0A5B1CSJ9_9BACT|nr:transglutaminaseTgpA domain-containing protein [Rubripirellula obstinata]KAA1262383.1 Protein-glutamine gamma-glutamyltransferase [Rubripirellula obstinata]
MNGSRIAGRLQFAFAVLTCLGGLVLASGTNTEIIPAIAIFFSIFGFLFVDWLRIFSLPPVAAYAAMGLAALYCITNFLDMDQPGNHQMISVSQLLVCVQAILMLQRKTIRIYEQLGVFCLLELVVAAVFNDALNYGLILIPICIIGLWALALLAIATSMNSVDGQFDRLLGAHQHAEPESDPSQSGLVQFDAAESGELMASVGKRLPGVVMISFAPAVLIVSAFFFYALPRTSEAGRVSNRGTAVVGFSEEVRLEQMGQMGQNSQVAARITLTRRPGGQPYQPISGIYLRGAVLELYRLERTGDASGRRGGSSSIWSAIGGRSINRQKRLPQEFFPSRFDAEGATGLTSDSIDVEIVYAASRAASLFSIPPYFEIDSNRDLLHVSDRWTLGREAEKYYYPRITYKFGTNAFRGGVQCEAIVSGLAMEVLSIEQSFDSNQNSDPEQTLTRTIRKQLMKADAEKRWSLYREETLEFDRRAMPTIAKIADQEARGLMKKSPDKPVNNYALAKALEKHFFINQRYTYSLNLNAESVVGLDPIEQFVSVDRVGHCQYFASALAMMLRSQGIPSRVVVGYKTDEFSEIGGQFLARQSHAHAWVEALIDHQDLDQRRISGGQPRSDQYWVRLDPTPSSFVDSNQTSGAGQVLNLAQDIWDGLIIDMDSDKQVQVLSNKGGSGALSQSYSQFVGHLSNAVSKIRAGDLGGGSLAKYDYFSWQAAILGIGICFAVAGLGTVMRRKQYGWAKKRSKLETRSIASRPSIDFYAIAMDQLKRLGIERLSAQTPNEFLRDSASQAAEPLTVLTSAFYQVRYRGRELTPDKNPTTPNPSQHQVDQALEELTRRVDAIRGGDDTAVSEDN